jgi:aryl-alcohol dehydrogenase-like predicted oxidoreductase
MLDDFVKAGKIRYYGVSVEKIEEALKAIEYPSVQKIGRASCRERVYVRV